jgi:hypothetical protein
MVRTVADGDEGRGSNYSILKSPHGILLFLVPSKNCAFPSEVYKGVSKWGVVADPNTHKPGKAKEGSNIRKIFARRPIVNACNLWVIGDMSFVGALVPKDDDLRACDDDLLCRDSGPSGLKVVEDAMDILKVLPNELANARVFWNGLVTVIVSFIMNGQPLDGTIVNKQAGDEWDLGHEEEGDIIMENGYGICPALWKACQSHSTNGRLNYGKVMWGDIKGAVVITDKKIEHGIACPTCHGLYDLVSERGNARITNGDCIKGLQVMDEAKGAALLLHAEEVGSVGGIWGLVDTSGELVLKDLDDIVKDPIGNGDVLVDP